MENLNLYVVAIYLVRENKKGALVDYSIIYKEDKNIIQSQAVGPLTVTDISSLIDDAIPLLLKYSSANFVADYSEGNAEGLTSDNIWQISVDCSRLSDYLTGKKLAVVLKDDVDYGLGRMWQSFTEAKVPYEIQLFRTLNDAKKWAESN